MMRAEGRWAMVVAATVALAACAYPPMGPTIPVTPGPGKSMDAFTADQADCRQYADQLIVPSLWAVNQQTVGMALVGTALGAGLGAAIGAASGAAVGTAAGASGSAYAQLPLQQQYDIAYAQCMAAHGDQVPGMGPPPGYQGGPPPGYPVPPPR